MLELKYLTKEFNEKKKKKKRALTNVNITFKNKGLYFILGKSGSGKTTLLNILAGFDTQTSGSYLVEGREFSELSESEKTTFRNKYIGVVFQEYNLLNKYDVYYNVTLPYRISNETIEETKVDDILNKLGILDLKYKKVNELSGGESQRVAIARCLLSETKVILADEPTGALDTTNSEELYKILKEISKEKLVIIVTHDIEAANKYNDHILKIEDGKLEYSDELEERNNLELPKKKRMSFLESFKLGLRLLFTKKFKGILSVILMIISTLLFVMSYSLKTNDLNQIYTETINKYNENHIILSKYKSRVNSNSYEIPFNESDLEDILELTEHGYYLYDIGTSFSYNNNYFSINYAMEYSDKLVDDLEIKLLYGNFPKSEKECLIPSCFYYYLENVGYSYNSLDEVSIGYKNVHFKITGVFDDGYSKEEYLDYRNGDLDEQSLSQKMRNDKLINTMIVYPDGTDIYRKYGIKIELSLHNTYYTNSVMLKDINDVQYVDIREGNLYLNLSVISKELGFDYVYGDALTDTEQQRVSNYIKNNSNISLKLTYPTYNMTEKLTLAGYYYSSNEDDVLIIKDRTRYLYEGYKNSSNYLVSTKYNFRKIVDKVMPNTISDKYGGFCSGGLSNSGFLKISNCYILSSIIEVRIDYEFYSYLFLAISLIFIFISMILMVSQTNTNIEENIREIGIIKSLGGSNLDLFNIFNTNNIINMLANVFATCILYPVGIDILNKICYRRMIFDIPLFFIDFKGILLIIIISLIVPIVSTIIPIYNLNKKSISRVIKSK